MKKTQFEKEIRVAMVQTGKNQKACVEHIGLNYSSFSTSLKNKSMRDESLMVLCNFLDLDFDKIIILKYEGQLEDFDKKISKLEYDIENEPNEKTVRYKLGRLMVMQSKYKTIENILRNN